MTTAGTERALNPAQPASSVDLCQRQRGRSGIRKRARPRNPPSRADAWDIRTRSGKPMARHPRVAVTLLASLTALCVQAAFAAPDPVPTEKTTIEIWWHDYGPFTAYVNELIEAYKKVRPNVTV